MIRANIIQRALLVPIALGGLLACLAVVSSLLRLGNTLDAPMRQLALDAIRAFFKSDSIGLIAIFVGAFVAAGVGLALAWVTHTRRLWFPALLALGLLSPIALPYDAICLSIRAMELPPMLASILVVLVRYVPVAFLFSRLALTDFSANAVSTFRSIGVAEWKGITFIVAPRLVVPMLAQLGFIFTFAALDHVGVARSTGGRIQTLGNDIQQWHRTVENGDIALVLSIMAALLSASLLSRANIYSWWASAYAHDRERSSLLPPRTGSLVLLGAVTAIYSAPVVLAVARAHNPIVGVWGIVGSFGEFAIPTLAYLMVGAALCFVTAFPIYYLLQWRNTARAPWVVTATLSATLICLVLPASTKGEVFLRAARILVEGSGNAVWIAVWSWVMMLPVIITVAAFHPRSRSNNVQLLIANLRLDREAKLAITAEHFLPVFASTYLAWVFLTIFDASLAPLAGFDVPISIWIRNSLETTLDREALAGATLFSVLLLAASAGALAYFQRKT